MFRWPKRRVHSAQLTPILPPKQTAGTPPPLSPAQTRGWPGDANSDILGTPQGIAELGGAVVQFATTKQF